MDGAGGYTTGAGGYTKKVIIVSVRILYFGFCVSGFGTGQDRAGQDRTGQDRIGQDGTGREDGTQVYAGIHLVYTGKKFSGGGWWWS